MDQLSYSGLAYTHKKKTTRKDRFIGSWLHFGATALLVAALQGNTLRRDSARLF